MVVPWSWDAFPIVNESSYVGLMTYSNSVTGGALGAAISFGIFFVAFVAMKKYPTTTAIAFSSYLTFILTVFLRLMGLVPDGLIWLWVIAMAVSTLLMGTSKGSGQV